MLSASVSIAVKLARAVRAKRALNHSSIKAGVGASGSSGKEVQAAITVCTIALLQCLAYFPSGTTCMAVCLANESPEFAIVRSVKCCSHLDKHLFYMCILRDI